MEYSHVKKYSPLKFHCPAKCLRNLIISKNYCFHTALIKYIIPITAIIIF